MNLPPVSDEGNTQRKGHNRSRHEMLPDNYHALGGHQMVDQGDSRAQLNENDVVPSSNSTDVAQYNPEHGNSGARTLPEGKNNGSNATFTLTADQLRHIHSYGNIVFFVPGERSILNYEFSPDYMNESHGVKIIRNVTNLNNPSGVDLSTPTQENLGFLSGNNGYNNIERNQVPNNVTDLNDPSGLDLSTPTQENLVNLSGNNGYNNIERNQVSKNNQKNIRVQENFNNLPSPKRLNININFAPPIYCEREMLQTEESLVSAKNANLEDNDATLSKDIENTASTSKRPNYRNEKDNDDDDDDLDLSLHL